MTFGKLYTFDRNSRSAVLKAVAKENNLDLEIVNVTLGELSEDFLKLNPMGQVPVFEGSNGFVLTECIAIAVYFASQNPNTTLLGKTKEDYASILRWMSLANSALLPNLGNWFGPLIGRGPYNKKNVDAAAAAVNKIVGIFENHLKTRTFLVGERITLSDLFVASLSSKGFEFVFDAQWRKSFPNFVRWYNLIVNQPSFKASLEVIFVEKAIEYTPPKKEPKPAAPKPEKKKEQKPEPEDDEEPAAPPAPKPKHPLEELGKAALVLDDWKRKYSNADTRTEALPWFWEHYNPDEWSLWRVDYKYNDELTHVFMSSNLITGLFTRLEASRKYIFGSMSVYGEANDNLISGAFIIRGHDHVVAFDVAPDWESYKFTRLDHTKPEDREFLEGVWAWDTPVDGKAHADGKICK